MIDRWRDLRFVLLLSIMVELMNCLVLDGDHSVAIKMLNSIKYHEGQR